MAARIPSLNAFISGLDLPLGHSLARSLYQRNLAATSPASQPPSASSDAHSDENSDADEPKPKGVLRQVNSYCIRGSRTEDWQVEQESIWRENVRLADKTKEARDELECLSRKGWVNETWVKESWKVRGSGT